jgi:hypothetical protein
MKKSNKLQAGLIIIASVGALVVYAASPAPTNLRTASNFAVLAGSAITNIGSSVVSGDLGISPGTAVTGFPPGVLNGTQHVADATAAQAKSDLSTAYNDLVGRTPVTRIGTELGGTIVGPGVYDSGDGTFGLTGTLTINAGGDQSAIFIFKSATTFITASGSNVVLAGGAQACNIFWIVGSSATLGTNSTLQGNLLALTSVTLTTNSRVIGSVLAQNGAVTLDSSTVTKSTCATPTASVATSTAPATSTPPTATSTPIIVVATSTPVVVATTSAVITVSSATTTFTQLPSPSLSVTNTFIPALPNTGIPPENKNTPLDLMILVGIIGSFVFLVVHKKNYAI